MLTKKHLDHLPPGTRVRVRQQLICADRPHVWDTQIDGTVVSCRPDKTGSWYAHGKDVRFWLMRLRIRKPDGELSDLVLDRGSQIEILHTPDP